MQTNNLFSAQRFVLLCKQSLIINKKRIAIFIGSYIGALSLVLAFFQSMGGFTVEKSNSCLLMFIFLFFAWGIIFASRAFPEFRSKEKCISYLMLPATITEKFIFEFLVRIVLYLILMPLLFWIVPNLEGAIVHLFVPELVNYKFSFGYAALKLMREVPADTSGKIIYLVVQGVLFTFLVQFMGAALFSKSSFLKTMLGISLAAAGYTLFGYLLFKGLNLQEYNAGKNVFYLDKGDAQLFFAILTSIVNLSLIAVAYFRLKEKEA